MSYPQQHAPHPPRQSRAGAVVIFVMLAAVVFGVMALVGALVADDTEATPVKAAATAEPTATDIEADVTAACRSALLARLDGGFEWYSESVQRGVGSAAGFRVTGTGSETVSGQQFGGERSWVCDAQAVPGEGIVVSDVGFVTA
ncbi:hypothetical protein [Actinophytocola sediminis]